MTTITWDDDRSPYRTGVSALFSADGKSAVLLRRGPKRHVHLVRWHLESDTFQHGQWMKGTARLCDLNADGSKLLYWARQWHGSSSITQGEAHPPRRDGAAEAVPAHTARGRRQVPRHHLHAAQAATPRARSNEGVWTALSTPPFFSALAIWPSYGHWTGGGIFADGATIILNEDRGGVVPMENVRLPRRLVVVPGLRERSRDPRAPLARAPSSLRHVGPFQALGQRLCAAGARAPEWAYAGHRRDLLFCADGQIFRVERWARVAPDDWLRAARQLIDLRPLSFSLMAAPGEAMRWVLPAVGVGRR